MSHFYGTIDNGKNNQRTLQGFATKGLSVEAQSWEGKIRVKLSVDENGNNIYKVYRENHGNSNITTGLIAEGTFNDFKPLSVGKINKQMRKDLNKIYS